MAYVNSKAFSRRYLALLGGIASIALMTAVQAPAQESKSAERLQYGRQVFVRNCAVCHTTLSPRIGDREAWAPFLQMDEKALVDAVISGGGSMAPRAGRPSLSDDDIKAAVQYIVSVSK
jgi:cytochrome c5